MIGKQYQATEAYLWSDGSVTFAEDGIGMNVDPGILLKMASRSMGGVFGGGDSEPVVVPAGLLDGLVREWLHTIYTPEGVKVWWREHALMEPSERAAKAFSLGEMVAT